MDDRIIVPIALTKLLDLISFDPYQNSPWIGVDALDLNEVWSCTASNPGRLLGELQYPCSVHTARVAWLINHWTNDGSDPIVIEVFSGVIVHDGYHRIAAAIARGDDHIYTDVGGYINEALDYGFPVDSWCTVNHS